jgi:hypothetical protein
MTDGAGSADTNVVVKQTIPRTEHVRIIMLMTDLM